jgi:3D (Asp-Asp-Asp) domain-containing protein
MIGRLFTIICVTATIYHANPEQTNEDYLTTASMKTIEDPDNPERWIAVSRDLESMGFTMGSEVIVTGAGDMDGVWTIEDRMNKRWRNRIDFLVPKKIKAGKWEKVTLKLKIDIESTYGNTSKIRAMSKMSILKSIWWSKIFRVRV